MTNTTIHRRRQRRKLPVPPMMLAGFAGLAGLVGFAAVDRGHLVEWVRLAEHGHLTRASERTVILDYLRENAGEPDSIQVVKAAPMTKQPGETRWQVKFREQGPFGPKIVRSMVFYIERGEVVRAVRWP